MMETLIELKRVSMSFSLGRKKQNAALKGINLIIKKGETLGLVGESGCGKSTLAHVIMGAYPQTKGKIYYKGQELKLKKHSQRKAFAKCTQMIFQNPYMSLDPCMTVEGIISENLEIHQCLDKGSRIKRVHELMAMTGLSKEYAKRYPREFSGGQRQRIGIARALAVNPEFLICDEPISALDISIRSQIVNLLIDLKEALGLTYLFISHDLNIVHHISDRIAVMYAGQIVELGNAQELYEMPLHPYTQMLQRAVLSPIPDSGKLGNDAGIAGEVAASSGEEKGCMFARRCDRASGLCRERLPELKECSKGHFIACFMTDTGDSAFITEKEQNTDADS